MHSSACGMCHFFFLTQKSMTIQERYQGCIDYWRAQLPTPTTELQYESPFQLLVAVMLSAQCTDKRINMVTPALFKAYPTAQTMAKATVDDLLRYIASVSYPNSKAKHLQVMSNMLVDKFQGEVPDTLEEMTTLPGVGRKTANVMLGMAFHKTAIAVDTHVFRVSNRIGLAKGKPPLDVEKTLSKHIAPDDQIKAHHWILLHGRYVCKALKPDCMNCGVKQYCKSYKGK